MKRNHARQDSVQETQRLYLEEVELAKARSLLTSTAASSGATSSSTTDPTPVNQVHSSSAPKTSPSVVPTPSLEVDSSSDQVVEKVSADTQPQKDLLQSDPSSGKPALDLPKRIDQSPVQSTPSSNNSNEFDLSKSSAEVEDLDESETLESLDDTDTVMLEPVRERKSGQSGDGGDTGFDASQIPPRATRSAHAPLYTEDLPERPQKKPRGNDPDIATMSVTTTKVRSFFLHHVP
jgi:hypothetical protein